MREDEKTDKENSELDSSKGQLLLSAQTVSAKSQQEASGGDTLSQGRRESERNAFSQKMCYMKQKNTSALEEGKITNFLSFT